MVHSTDDPDFDARWAAWLARGAAHERIVRRRLMVVLPAVLVIAIAVYVWFVR